MLEQAATILKAGGIVAAPTDTVYGLFCDARRDEAVKMVYNAKGRPSYNPLIVHVSDVVMAESFAVFTQESHFLACHFWEAIQKPLSLVLPLRPNSGISKMVTAGLDTVAIRCPAHPVALELIARCGFPLAAPSANTSNHLSPTSKEMVEADLGAKIPMVLDGGQCKVGIESTILDMTHEPYTILRPGGVGIEEVQSFLHRGLVVNQQHDNILAPGMMKKHYSPYLPLRINAREREEGEAFMAFGPGMSDFDLNLSETGNLEEAARNLFGMLSILDNSKKYKGIAVMPIPEYGLGLGINDRLHRAAAK